MNREDIIRMAQECKLIGMRPHLDGIYQEEIERFAALVSAAEREACAKLCDELETCSDAEFYGHEFAAAIRARGQV